MSDTGGKPVVFAPMCMNDVDIVLFDNGTKGKEVMQVVNAIKVPPHADGVTGDIIFFCGIFHGIPLPTDKYYGNASGA